MKKFLIAFIAMFIFSGVSFGQKNNSVKKDIDGTIMLMAVNMAKAEYAKGTDQATFIEASGATSTQEINFIKKLHQFLENGTPNDRILSEGGSVVSDLRDYAKGKDSNQLFKGNPTQAGKGIFGWIKRIAQAIIDILDTLCDLHPIFC